MFTAQVQLEVVEAVAKRVDPAHLPNLALGSFALLVGVTARALGDDDGARVASALGAPN